MNTTSKQLFLLGKVFPEEDLDNDNRKPPETISFVSLTQLPDSKILSSVSDVSSPKLSTVLVQLIFALLSRLLQPTKYLLVSFTQKILPERRWKIGSKSNSLNYLVTVLYLIRLRAINCGFHLLPTYWWTHCENSVLWLQSSAQVGTIGLNCSNLVREYWSVSDEFWSQSVVVVPIKTFCNCLQLPGGSPTPGWSTPAFFSDVIW